ncbi:MAG: hypothetical protein COB16_17480 [Rhodobacteraceae bacterium]|nr:MAG: hypothetical protein COB16_17480 [Paracoccaceae bacterium]
MTTWKKTVLRSRYTIACNKFERAKSIGKTLLAALAVTIGLSGINGQAFASLQPYVVHNDRGGFVRDRLREIRNLRASGQPVEIRGAVCYSTCTMLLGLPQTCISPKTVFGFHGPSRSGRRLPPEDFEYYSQVIAQYYPKPLKDWYMKKGRKRINGLHRIKGTEIIRMGARAC